MNLLKYIFGFIAISIVFSCTPFSGDDGDFLNGFSNSSNSSSTGTATFTKRKLKKITSTETSGEISTITYAYTGDNLTTVTAEDNSEKNVYTLTYTSGALTHMEFTSTTSGQTLLNKMDLTYTSGKLTKATGNISASGVETMIQTTNFTYDSAGKISKIYTAMSTPNPSDPTKYILATTLQSDIKFTSNNVSYWKLTTNTYTNGTTLLNSIIDETTATKNDSYQNPYNELPSTFLLLSCQFGGTGFGPFSLSTNNFMSYTSKTTVSGVATTQSGTHTLYYNTSGYPSVMIDNLGAKSILEYY